MAIHRKADGSVTIDPTNDIKGLRVEKSGNENVKFTVIFHPGSTTAAVISWKRALEILFLKDGGTKIFFGSELVKAVRNVNPIGFGSITRLYFVPPPGETCDFVCVATRDLGEALVALIE